MTAMLMVWLAMGTTHGDSQTLYSFTGQSDGSFPFGGLAVGPNGALYGTTQYGGATTACPSGYSGAVFQMLPPVSAVGGWTESIIHGFASDDHCFAFPLAAPTVGPSGELYGTDYYGGANFVGSVYELMPPSTAGGAWTKATLYSFAFTVGAPQNPVAGVIRGKNGVLYGTVQFAGTSQICGLTEGDYYGCGAVYSLTPPASAGGSWTEQTLYVFQGGTDGAFPLNKLTLGSHGELYGVTSTGGTGTACTARNVSGPYFNVATSGCGTVFELDPPTNSDGRWTETLLHSFTGERDGGFPNGLTYHGGKLFGTVTFGGDPSNCGGVGCGGVFELSPPEWKGQPWTENVIYSFASGQDGLFPAAGVIAGKDGTLYGTTRDGGDTAACPQNPGCGIVYQLKPPLDPGDHWREQVLHRFSVVDGWLPTAGVVIGPDGNLYGTTWQGDTSANCVGGCGVVFKVEPQKGWEDQ
jgi:hypothetical protein